MPVQSHGYGWSHGRDEHCGGQWGHDCQHYFAAGFLRTDPGVLESEEPSGCKTVSGKFPGLQHPSDRYPFQRDPYPDGGS
mgnify:CR=1 FL=1